MDKKKQNQMNKGIQDLIKEASLHSEKKLKGNHFAPSNLSSVHLDTYSDKKKEAPIAKSPQKKLKQNPNEMRESNSKMLKRNHLKSNEASDNSIVKIQKTLSASSKDASHKKKSRKKVWQKGSVPSQNHYVSVIDRRIDMKKLKGKSLLCVGGVRSGKSDFALEWANLFAGKKAFIATMQSPKDFEEKEIITEKDLKKQAAKPKAVKNIPTEAQERKFDDSPRKLQADAVRDAYRIHTRMDNASSDFSYHSHVSSKFEKNNYGAERNDSAYTAITKKHEDLRTSPETDQSLINDIVQKISDDKSNPHCMELDHRISKHQAQRGKSWLTIEEPLDIVRALHRAKDEKCSVAIIDCLTLWITNLMLQKKSDKQIFNKIEELADLLKNPPLPIAIVSNEVGAGVVPDNALARRFRDLQGKANQILARDASCVIVSMCGLPLLLKG